MNLRPCGTWRRHLEVPGSKVRFFGTCKCKEYFLVHLFYFFLWFPSIAPSLFHLVMGKMAIGLAILIYPSRSWLVGSYCCSHTVSQGFVLVFPSASLHTCITERWRKAVTDQTAVLRMITSRPSAFCHLLFSFKSFKRNDYTLLPVLRASRKRHHWPDKVRGMDMRLE